jgi:hypothetical protein
MKLKLGLLIGLLTLFGWAGSGLAQAAPGSGRSTVPPVLIIVANKLDSNDVFQSKLPGLQRLLRESSSGLMSIRSGAGYTKSNSGYLTLGTGTRCAIPDEIGGLMREDEPFLGVAARDFWGWSVAQGNKVKSNGLVVPEIGRVGELTKHGSRTTVPGLLGGFFRANRWQTVVYSNSDHFRKPFRPGGLLLMDQRGKVDEGRIEANWNVTDPQFPYLQRVDPDKAFALLQTAVQPHRVILFDFDDFARLDNYREAMLAGTYQKAKQAALRRFDHLLLRIIKQWPVRKLSLVVVSPSNSWEAVKQKRLLGPLLIRAGQFRHGGVLTSGTTNWPGIVSSIDFVPTLLSVAHLAADRQLDGRVMKGITAAGQLPLIMTLHQRINAALAVQRPILDWYLTLITVGWLLGLVCCYFKFGKWSEWVLTGVAVIPLVLILMPLLPAGSWQVNIFLVITVGLSALVNALPEYQDRFLLLAGATWAVLVVDQVTGWHLIRYSPLGYNPAAGARYYGIGNEFMGIFLPLALLMAEVIYQKTKQRWPALLILAISTMVLGWPQLGINFGGTLAALVGFSWYLFRLYHWDLRNKKMWLTIGVGVILIIMVGYWDSLRAAGQQTHVGRFFSLIFSNRFGKVLLIVVRKLEMNLKLMAISPWARIAWLALGLALVNRCLTKKPLFVTATKRLGPAMVITGLAAFAFNDSGIVAMATGLAFGFSYLLIASQKENNLEARRSSLVVRSGPNPDPDSQD